MDKAVLKKFAIESRQDLMQRMENKIKTFYIDEEFSKQQSGDVYILANSKHSLNLSKEEYTKRELLIKRINELGLDQVIEEAAYTWFNRIVAIRYMEIHDYLPLTRDNQSLGIRVLSSKDNTPDPEIMKFTNLVNPELDIDFKKEKYAELKDDNEKFKYILLLVCKKLGRVIPQVFDGVTDYIDILIPDNLLNESGFVNKIVAEVPVENYEQVEIMGWIYQFYNSEKKDEVFSNLKKNIKVTKNNLPAATQLFTPDWIVKYMVENSLGNLWLSSNPQSELKKELKYYVGDLEPEKNFSVNLENLKILDPCMGSGHILVYVFRLLYKMYKEQGYLEKDISINILKNNIYGLDIDERAGQLSYLALILEARKCDKCIFSKINELNLWTILESNDISYEKINLIKNEQNEQIINYILEIFKDAKEYGSLLKVNKYDYDNIINDIEKYKNNMKNIFEIEEYKYLKKYFLPLVYEAKILSETYDIVITNPPYMGSSSMDLKLKKYIDKEYKKGKLDLFAAFMEKAMQLAKEEKYISMITMHSWMFLSSYKDLREYLLNNFFIENMLHLGIGSFDEMNGYHVLATTFILKKTSDNNKFGNYIRLVDYYNHQDKIKEFENKENYYKFNQTDFKDIPNDIIVYWLPKKIISIFKEEKKLSDYAETKQGMATGNNNKFLRFWFEIDFNKIGFYMHDVQEALESGKKWFPYNKNGNFRKWYGNNEVVIAFDRENYNILANMGNHLPSRQYYFKKGITWSLFGWEAFSVRFKDYGFVFDVSGSSAFMNDSLIYYILGFLSSSIAFYFLAILAPTVNFQIGNIADLPLIVPKDSQIIEQINSLVKENIYLAKSDWDSFETSWDFKTHPFIEFKGKDIRESYNNWTDICKMRFNKMKQNEIQLDNLFKEIYNIKDIFIKPIDNKWISVYIPNEKNDIKSFISYIVGCMFGRYSISHQGLCYTGGQFNFDLCQKYNVDENNIIPILEDDYFKDDIIRKFKKIVSDIYGENLVNNTIEYIAETLGKKGTETNEETLRRYFLNDFYSDHIKRYQKSPIYWLFDSGKQNGFKALIYMHRYNEKIVPKIRIDYLHKVQTAYENNLHDINSKLIVDLPVSEKKELQKKQVALNAKLQEIKEYDEKIAHIANQRISIDLDDGIKVNYEKFKDILAKIK